MTSQTFTTSGSWTAPAGVTSVTVECLGAGAGGAGSGTGGARHGGGGGGGAYASSVVTVSPGTAYSIVVAPAPGVNTSGGDSSFGGGTVVAAGGSVGTSVIVSGNAGGGIGGQLAACTGTTKYIGGKGFGPGAGTGFGGGGGSAASTTAAGVAAQDNLGVSATGTVLGGLSGKGGNGSIQDGTQGGAGNNYGGGGGGGYSNGTSIATGGAGSQGVVVLTWTASTAPAAPAAPTVSLAASPSRTVTVTWTAVSGASTYNLYQDGSSIQTGLTGTSTTVANVAEGTHTFALSATNAVGTSATGSTTSITVDRTAPTVPTITSLTKPTTTSTLLKWTGSSDTAAYIVRVNGTPLAEQPAGAVVNFLGSGNNGNADGTGVAATMSAPWGVAFDTSGNLYFSDNNATYGNRVRKSTAAGVVTTLATGLNGPRGIGVDSSGNVYVANYGTFTIKKIDSAGTVTTFAGSGFSGSTNATGTSASFAQPVDIAVDSSNNVYVADSSNSKIRKITPAGLVSNFISVISPTAVAIDSSGNFYVFDYGTNRLGKYDSSGTLIAWLAGTNGVAGNVDGTGTSAQFGEVRGLKVDASGNIYAADRTYSTVRMITQAGVVTTVATGINQASGLAFDSTGNLFVSGYNEARIKEVILVPSLTQTGLSDGTYTYEVSARDTANNWSAYSAPQSVTISSLPAVPATPTASLAAVPSRTVTVSWTAVSGATSYAVYQDGASVQTGVTGTSTTIANVTDGTHTFSVASTNAAGTSAQSSTTSLTIDRTAPSAISNLSAGWAGPSSRTVTLSWTVPAGSPVSYVVYRDGAQIGTPSTNSYSDTPGSDGTYSYMVTSLDAAGNVSTGSNVSSVTVDTTPPSVPVISSVTNTGSSVTVTWNTNTDAASYQVYRNGVSAGTTSNTTLTQTVGDGTYTYTVRAFDTAGNVSAQSGGVAITVDTTPPTVPIVSTVLSAVPSRTVTVSWNSNSDAVLYEVEDGSTSLGTTTSTSYTINNVTDGSHDYRVRAKDSVGNWSVYSVSSPIVVDRTAPSVPSGLVGSQTSQTSRQVTLSWSASTGSPSNYKVYRDGVLVSTVASSSTTATDTPSLDATYTYTVSAIDSTGNESSQSSGASVTVLLLVAPTTPSAPVLILDDASRTVTVSWNAVATASSYEVTRDGASIGTTSSTTMVNTPTGDGTYVYKVRAINAAGMSAYSAGTSVAIDRTAPTTPNAVSAVQSPVTSRNVTVSWTSPNDAVQSRIYRNGALIATVSSSPYLDTSLSSDGTYTYTVSNADAANNWSDQSSGVSVAVVRVVTPAAPATPTATLMASPSRAVTVSWTPVSGASTYTVYMDNVAQANGLTVTSYNITNIPDGTHTFSVDATNVAGTSAQSAVTTLNIDRTPPAAPVITATWISGTRLVRIDWTFDSDAAMYEIRRSGTTLTSTESGSNYIDTVPVDGMYIYTARSVDSSGNWSTISAGAQVTVDTTAPAVPTGLRGDATRYTTLITWDGDADVSVYEIARNGVTIGQTVLPSFADSIPGYGSYFYKVRAKDAANNWSAWSAEVEIDSLDREPPAVPVSLTATGAGGKKVSLEWNSDSDVSVWEIYRDGSFISSRTVPNFLDTTSNYGTFKYKVRAKDLAGNYSAFSDEISFKIDAGIPTLGRAPLTEYTIGQREDDDSYDQIRRLSRDDASGDEGVIHDKIWRDEHPDDVEQ